MIPIIIMLAFFVGIGIGVYIPSLMGKNTVKPNNTIQLNAQQREALASLSEHKARLLEEESETLYGKGIISTDMHTSQSNEIQTYKTLSKTLRTRKSISSN